MSQDQDHITQGLVNKYKSEGASPGKLAELYCKSLPTFNRWIGPYIKDIGPRLGWYYTPNQVQIIFDKLGEP